MPQEPPHAAEVVSGTHQLIVAVVFVKLALLLHVGVTARS